MPSWKSPTSAAVVLKIDWTGHEQMIRNLRLLDNAIVEIVKPALRTGANMVATAAKANLEFAKDTGTLQKSVGVKLWTSGDQMQLVAYIGPRRKHGRMISGPQAGKKSFDKDAGRHTRTGGRQRIPTRYAHFVEKRIKFMKQAMDMAGPGAMALVFSTIDKKIQQTVARMPKGKPLGR